MSMPVGLYSPILKTSMIPVGGDKMIKPNSLKKIAPLKTPKSYGYGKLECNIISYIGFNNTKCNK